MYPNRLFFSALLLLMFITRTVNGQNARSKKSRRLLPPVAIASDNQEFDYGSFDPAIFTDYGQPAVGPGVTDIPMWKKILPGVTYPPMFNQPFPPEIQMFMKAVDFTKLERLCRTQIGVSRAGRLLREFSANAVDIAQGLFTSDLFSSLGVEFLPIPLEQTMCAILGRLNKPKSIFDYIADSLLSIFPLKDLLL